MEAADDIVYSAADIEDGVKKKLLTWQLVRNAIGKCDQTSASKVIARLLRILKIEREDETRGFEDNVLATALRTAVIGEMVDSVFNEFTQNYEQIMDGNYFSSLVDSCSAAGVVDCLKKLARNHVFCDPSILKLELMGKHVICDLMDVFWDGAIALPLEGMPISKKFTGKAGALLSDNYRKVFQHFATSEENQLPEIYHRFQLVTDYICGMTDSFAKRLHSELKNGG